MDEASEPIPAATLILMRPGRTDAPELLVMERSASMAFAAGAMVFPGGRIDPGDEALAQSVGGDVEFAAARIAAIRETIEETGVAVGLTRMPPPDSVRHMRQALEQGVGFASLLQDLGLELDLAALTPFARWCPGLHRARRFDTLFFIAEAMHADQDHSVAEAEGVRTLWASAAELIAEADEGRAQIIFPTRRNLERLERFASIEEARADAILYPINIVSPWIEEREGTQWLCIPDGIGYPVTAELLSKTNRG